MKKGSIFIIIAIALAATIFYGVRYVRQPLETQEIQMVKREEKFSGQAYIIRHEGVYSAESAGTIYHYANEGARVRKNTLVSAVYNGVVEEETLQELNTIDQKIAQIEADSGKSTLYVADVSKEENRLESIRNEIVEAASENDASKIPEYKERINQIQSGETLDPESTLADLQQKRSEIENNIGQGKTDIYSEMSGIFSTAIDGLEQVLTPESILTYTVEEFEHIPEPRMAATQKTIANIGETVCKVADNHVWYVMMLVDKEDVANVKTGTVAEIRFDKIPGVQTEVSVMQITEEPEGDRAVLILKSERYSEGAFSIRESMAEVILKTYEGYEVPVHAVRVKDGARGVMVQRTGGEVFKKCEVIYTDPKTETAIIQGISGEINGLNIGDRIIIGEKTDNPNSQ